MRKAMIKKLHKTMLRAVLLTWAILANAEGTSWAQPEIEGNKQQGIQHEAFWKQALEDAQPLNVEVVGMIEQDGVSIQRLRYTGSSWHGQRQRVYALYAHPEGNGPFPAVLQIHGGGQSCYPQNVAYFVKHGYACFSFDWTGPRDGRPADSVTQWSGPIAGNHFGGEQLDPEDVVLLHATLAAIRGIDFLTLQPEVDAQRIGVQGVSWGGFLTWLVNGLDPRLKAAVPVYGIGEQAEQWNDMGRALHNRSEAVRAQWRELFDPVSFAPTQHGAVLYVDGANDFFGPQDLAEARLAMLRVDHRRAYAPNRMHSLDEGSVAAGMAWLDAHLKDGAPAMPMEPVPTFESNAEGDLIATVKPDTSHGVRSVHFDLSRGGQLPLLRCWLSIEAQRGGDATWSATLPLISATDSIAVVAQVTYESGATLSSAVQQFRPAQRVSPRPRGKALVSNTIFDAGDGLGGVYLPASVDFFGVDPVSARLNVEQIAGRAALKWEPVGGSSGNITFTTRRVVDAGTQTGGTADLEIWTHGVAKLRLRTNHFLREPEAQMHEANVTAGSGWQRSIVRLADLVLMNEDTDKPMGEVANPPANWNEVHQLSVICEPVAGEPVALGSLAWVRDAAATSEDLK